jgi:hypothetical protein
MEKIYIETGTNKKYKQDTDYSEEKDIEESGKFKRAKRYIQEQRPLIVKSESFPPDQTCSICLELLSKKKWVKTFPCSNKKHTFHIQCINKWKETGCDNCPLCRKDLSKKIITEFHIPVYDSNGRVTFPNKDFFFYKCLEQIPKKKQCRWCLGSFRIQDIRTLKRNEPIFGELDNKTWDEISEIINNKCKLYNLCIHCHDQICENDNYDDNFNEHYNEQFDENTDNDSSEESSSQSSLSDARDDMDDMNDAQIREFSETWGYDLIADFSDVINLYDSRRITDFLNHRDTLDTILSSLSSVWRDEPLTSSNDESETSSNDESETENPEEFTSEPDNEIKDCLENIIDRIVENNN